MTTKFFMFAQNNSGGSFDIDDQVCEKVIIEANDADEANAIAESHGIYFDGVSKGMDCDCCGDRWRQADNYDSELYPAIYGSHIDNCGDSVIVYYLSGECFRRTKPRDGNSWFQ